MPRPGVVYDQGGVLVVGGQIAAVPRGDAALRRAAAQAVEVVDLGDAVLTPGLVNAHTHLELGALGDQLPRAADFGDWAGALVAGRLACSREVLIRGYREGAQGLLASGTTLVGDIDSLGLWEAVPATAAPRRRVYREVLDARDAARRRALVDAIADPLDGGHETLEGLSPHAPFSVSDALFAEVSTVAAGRGLPIAMHWAETEEEVAWLDGAPGWFDRFFPREAGMAGLDALERHGLLGPTTSLIHGNHPRPGEVARVAAAGATVVHCPGSHAYFDRSPFALAAWRAAGVPIALGTDSRASNDALDMRRELALLRAAHPDLDPIDAWGAATEAGAAALGLDGLVGRLEPGAWADLAAFQADGEPVVGESVFDWLTAASPAVAEVWVGGERRSN